jgi:hypothetical protein
MAERKFSSIGTMLVTRSGVSALGGSCAIGGRSAGAAEEEVRSTANTQLQAAKKRIADTNGTSLRFISLLLEN